MRKCALPSKDTTQTMASRSKQTGKVNRRSGILRAAEKLMHSRGLSGVTTRKISQEAGCSEGALYVHFQGRFELLLAMLEESLPKMLRPLQTLQESVGQGSAQGNLAQAVEGIFKFHQRVVATTAGLFAEPQLLTAYRNSRCVCSRSILVRSNDWGASILGRTQILPPT